MSHFRTTAPFWEHQVILHLFFFFFVYKHGKKPVTSNTLYSGSVPLGQLSHGSIGIVQKIEFEIRTGLGCTTIETSRKVVLDSPSVCVRVCLCVSARESDCPSVGLAVAFSANSHGCKGKPIEIKRCMFGHIRQCVVSIFVSICPPIFKIIQ